VKLYFSHPTPNLLKQLGVGPFALETDLMQILSENMDKYKSLVEAEAPADWQEIKEQVAARVVQQQQDEEQAAKQQRSRPPPPVAPRPRSTLSAQEATEFVDALQVAEQTKSTQQQSTAQGQLAAPAASAAEQLADKPGQHGRRPGTARRTASAAPAAAQDVGGGGPAGAGSSKSRSRGSTSSRKTTSSAAAGASSSNEQQVRRRGRTSTNNSTSSGAGQAERGTGGGSGRRSSRRSTSTAEKE
jgi:hypothetical protein